MVKQNKGVDKYVKCSFCDEIAESVLTMISDGQVEETAFCFGHLLTYKHSEYKFDVENESNVDDFEISEYLTVEKKNKKEGFLKKIESIVDSRNDLLSFLKRKMNKYADDEEFKKAAKIKEKIKALEGTKNDSSRSK